MLYQIIPESVVIGLCILLAGGFTYLGFKIFARHGGIFARHSIKFLLLFWLSLAVIPALLDYNNIVWSDLLTVVGCFVGVPLGMVLVLWLPGALEDGLWNLVFRVKGRGE